MGIVIKSMKIMCKETLRLLTTVVNWPACYFLTSSSDGIAELSSFSTWFENFIKLECEVNFMLLFSLAGILSPCLPIV